jgi:hypothetical protein
VLLCTALCCSALYRSALCCTVQRALQCQLFIMLTICKACYCTNMHVLLMWRHAMSRPMTEMKQANKPSISQQTKKEQVNSKLRIFLALESVNVQVMACWSLVCSTSHRIASLFELIRVTEEKTGQDTTGRGRDREDCPDHYHPSIHSFIHSSIHSSFLNPIVCFKKCSCSSRL